MMALAILLYCFIIFCMVFVMMSAAFVLAIRLGMFDMKDNPDSISWEKFKSWFKKDKNAQK